MTEGKSEGRQRAVIMEGTGGVWRARTPSGEIRDVSLRGRLKKSTEIKLAVGDEVELEEDTRGGAWAVAEILPRKSRLARREPGSGYGERIVVANVDQVVIVFAAAKPEPHTRMLDRFLVIAEANGLLARIVVNKIDLVPREEAEKVFGDYARAGYDVHYTSIKAPTGLQELRDSLNGLSSVFSGPSGVGKSSLLNSIFPGLNLRIGEISESVNKGRHTTVGAVMHPLPGGEGGGGYVVDSPGLREVGMWHLAADELAVHFPEFRPYIESCRFGDCTHTVEPGCALRDAVESGAVSAARYDSYCRLREELALSDKQWIKKEKPAQRR